MAEEMIKLKSLLKEMANDGIWYHGSAQPVTKFSYNKVGKGVDKIHSYWGWGIYFIKARERAEKFGEVVMEVNIPPMADIMWVKVSKNQLRKVYNGMVRDKVKLPPDLEQSWDVQVWGPDTVIDDIPEFYDFIGRILKVREPKRISDFLLSCGIDGLRVRDDVNDDILVVFNDRIISKPKILGNSNDTINKSNMGLGGGGAAASLATSASHLNKMEKYD